MKNKRKLTIEDINAIYYMYLIYLQNDRSTDIYDYVQILSNQYEKLTNGKVNLLQYLDEYMIDEPSELFDLVKDEHSKYIE